MFARICRVMVFGLIATYGVAGALANSDAPAKDADKSTHPAAEDKPNPMAINPDLAVYTGVVFVVLMLVLSKFAWGPIAAGLEKREHAIAENIDAAERANKEAHEVLGEYEKKLATAQEQVKAMIEEARRDATATKETILAEAKAAAQAEKDRAVREVEMATDKALKELAEKSANIAVDLAGRIVQQKLTANDHAKLIQDAVGKFASRN